jgi:hypothetical protein
VVSGRYGRVGGNGIAVSPDDRTLYVTGRLMGAMPPADLKLPPGAPTPTGGLVAFDIQPDGSLTNERQFAWAGGDGTAVDTQGRLYTPATVPGIDPRNGESLASFRRRRHARSFRQAGQADIVLHPAQRPDVGLCDRHAGERLPGHRVEAIAVSGRISRCSNVATWLAPHRTPS